MSTKAALVNSQKILGRELKLLKMLGAGAYGEVHLAVPMKGAKKATFTYPARVAVKIIHKHLCTADQVAALLKELDALRRLRHPCIVNYIGVWREASTRSKYYESYCLAMDYCDGGDLDRLLREAVRQQNFLPPERVARLMACVFSGLNYSHAHRIIHRDVKPANVFLTKTIPASSPERSIGGGIDRALIGDYGLARPLDKTMQMVKTRVGTPCYCSPEIVAGEDYTSKTDVFSAGVMFFELMALESPFWKRSYTEIQCFERIVHHDPLPRLQQRCLAHFGESLVRIVCRCLSKHEQERPTAYEVLTSFSARVRRSLTVMKIPVYADKAARDASRDLSVHPPAGQTVAKCAAPAIAAAVAAAPAAADASPTDPSPVHAVGSATKKTLSSSGRGSGVGTRPSNTAPTPTRRLFQLLNTEFPMPLDGALLNVVDSELRIYLLLKVLMITEGVQQSWSAGQTRSALTEEELRKLICNLLQDTEVRRPIESIKAIADALVRTCHDRVPPTR